MPTTTVRTCEDAGCHGCGDSLTLELKPEYAAIAASGSGQILATVISYTLASNGDHIYMVSYEDDQTIPRATLVTCDQVAKICCAGCAADYQQAAIDALEDRDLALVTQVAHGFSIPSSGLLPLAHDGSAYVGAQADVAANVADVVAVGLPSEDLILLQASGFYSMPSHGLTVGEWYALDPAAAGGLVLRSSLTIGVDIVQSVVFAVSADILKIELGQAQLP